MNLVLRGIFDFYLQHTLSDGFTDPDCIAIIKAYTLKHSGNHGIVAIRLLIFLHYAM